MPKIEKAVTALETLADGTGPFLCGPELSLADLHVVPVMAYFSMHAGGPEGAREIAEAGRWWQLISTRPSMVKTQPQLG